MRSGLRLVVVTALTLAAGAGAVRLRAGAAALDLFRVRDVRLAGGHYLSEQEAIVAAAIPPDANVWDDPGAWREGLARHPLVKSARIRRRLPSSLVLEVEERVPVALLANPTLDPVDGEGNVLPIDPARHRLDLPVVRPPAGHRDDAAPGPPGSPLAALTAEMARLTEHDPGFAREVSVLSANGSGDLEALWGEEGTSLLFRAPLTHQRVLEARAALADAGLRFPGRRAATVDLRFADQVVVRFASSRR